MIANGSDILMYNIKAENLYDGFCKNIELFEFSNTQKIQNITKIQIT